MRPPRRWTSASSSRPRRRPASRTSGRCRSRSPSACWTRTAGRFARHRGWWCWIRPRAPRSASRTCAARRCVSALRGFSAPVNLSTDAPAKDAYVLLAADPDLFNRWEAGQGLARDLILTRAAGTPDEVGEERYAEALERALKDQSADAGVQGAAAGAAQRAGPGGDRRARRSGRDPRRARGPAGAHGRAIWTPSCATCTAGCRTPGRSRPTPSRPAAARCATRSSS